MSRVIKLHDATRTAKVRAMMAMERPRMPESAVIPIDSQLVGLRSEVARLAEELGAARAEIGQLVTAVEQALEDGREEGRRAGLAEADDGRAARLQRLESASAQALTLFDARIASVERLAPLIARQGLARILGDPGRHADLLGLIIRRQLETLETKTVVRIEVSSRDFGETAELAALAESLGRPDLRIDASEDLEAGDCHIKLLLGGLEVGLRQQWSVLSGILDDLVEPEPTP